ncbi:MAG: hypothetical protein R3B96_17760 [Pirellulaceae bacterium]
MYERVVLAHGVRYGNDLAYREELEGFQDRNPESPSLTSPRRVGTIISMR